LNASGLHNSIVLSGIINLFLGLPFFYNFQLLALLVMYGYESERETIKELNTQNMDLSVAFLTCMCV
jgi:hypothetical protein